MANNFVRMVFAVVKENGYNTDGMSYDEAYKIFEQLGGEKNWANKAYDFDEKDRKPKKILQLPPQEYAELCSAIRTKYANKIKKDGFMLYKDSFYRYNYDKEKELILCVEKFPINGNENRINNIIRRKK